VFVRAWCCNLMNYSVLINYNPGRVTIRPEYRVIDNNYSASVQKQTLYFN